MNPSFPSDITRPTARGRRSPRVLVVDDEADLRELLELTLVGMGLDVDCAADLGQARQLLASSRYSLCLTDMRLPDGDGLSLVSEISAAHPETPVAVITAFGSAETAVAALKAGAFDYLPKPVALDALRTLVRSALRLSALDEPMADSPSAAGAVPVAPDLASVASAHKPPSGQRSVDAETGAALVAAARTRSSGGPGQLLGVSSAIEVVRESIGRLARSMAPVAITGESGSGKELAARLIHQGGSRADQPFIAVNCGAIPEALMESEFFGHRRGAFTGADQDRIGFFQAASGGTLFLDEVADLPLAMQVKLLRAIQERCVRRVGATVEEPVDVRIVSATHQDLARCVAEGRFRQDLYYRLNVIELRVPALRERLTDVPMLADSLLAKLAARAGLRVVPRLSSITQSYLQTYQFPGNVRELENILERAIAFSNGEVINIEDLGLRPDIDDIADDDHALVTGVAAEPTASGSAPPIAGSDAMAGGSGPPVVSDDGIPESLPNYLEWLEREAIARALDKTRQNRTAAARLLGISFRALRHRMQRLDMQ
jgi:two-component system response regulator PilR (NtrC family)